jgi:EAL domain-containing protein (putative c-di-GMP-specific phosphodiesterase class I)
MHRDAEEKMLITDGLRKAVDQNELSVFYQPLIDMRTGKIAGVEALIRWERSKGCMVSPLAFVPIAESTGLIVPLGEWVLKTACGQNMAWQKAGFPQVPVAVNISARQLHDHGFSDKVVGILRETGLDPKYLILEITESTAMEDIEESIKILNRLYRIGIQIFIDDFGSGYSSIGRLKSLPVHALKIDHLFTQHIVDDPDDAAIVMSIMAMAHSLNIRVVVEGVETPEQLECLRSMKWTIDYPLQCDEVQGYLFSRPVPADAFTNLFIAQQKHGILPTA